MTRQNNTRSNTAFERFAPAEGTRPSINFLITKHLKARVRDGKPYHGGCAGFFLVASARQMSCSVRANKISGRNRSRPSRAGLLESYHPHDCSSPRPDGLA